MKYLLIYLLDVKKDNFAKLQADTACLISYFSEPKKISS